MSNVRVRFAPSPTGFFHIGSARTALFNWLYARHTGGTFILRIEDTDQARNSEAFLTLIYDSLTWLGMDWDEGPNPNGAGERGSFGPYRQSQRADIYQRYKQKLLDGGRAYEKDGAIWFKLLGERYKVFDDHRKKEVEKVKAAPVVIDDKIRGRVERQEDEDFVIFRSDGNPVFHFVNVVDDIEMKVSHIIRGEDHLSNTSKHVRLYEGFGVTAPVFAHIPLILKSPEMGQGKMSKRDKGALIEEYRKSPYNYLPEALVNYLALLGWNPGDDREKMSIADIVKLFELSGVNQSNAKFDAKKLAHMNMLYTQELSNERFTGLTSQAITETCGKISVLEDQDYLRKIALLAQPKVKSIGEMPNYARYFWTTPVPTPLPTPTPTPTPMPTPTLGVTSTFVDFPVTFLIDLKLQEKIMAKGDPKARLAEMIATVPRMDFSSDAAIENGLNALAQSKGLGFGDYQAVARLAVSGTNAGPSITSMFRVLGKDRVLARLQKFLAGV